jgi:hypothetical protein
VRYPIATVSIGIATTAVRSFADFGEVVTAATETKQAAKRRAGSCFTVDRRSGA